MHPPVGGHAQAGHQQRTRQQQRAAPAVQQPPGNGAGHKRRHWQGQRGPAGFQGGIARHQLQPLAEHQLHAQQRSRRGQCSHHRHAERGVAEQFQVQQRVGAAALAAHKDGQKRRAQHQGQQRHGPVRRGLARFLDGVGAGHQTHHHLQAGDAVPGALAVAARGGDIAPGQRQRDQHNGHVDQEHRTPPEMFQQCAAHHRTEGRAARRHRGPDADGQGAFLVIAKAQSDHRQRGRHHHGGAHAQQRTRRNQHAGIGCKRRQQRGRAKHHQARQQQCLVTELVAQRAHAQQQARDDQRVDVDDPQLGRGTGRQIVCQPGQGGVEHRHVDDDQQQGHGHNAQHQPAVARGGSGVEGSGNRQNHDKTNAYQPALQLCGCAKTA